MFFSENNHIHGGCFLLPVECSDVTCYTLIMTYKFATVILQEGKWYIARAVELGVVSQGKTVPEALKNLKEAAELFLEIKKTTGHWSLFIG